MNAPDDEDLIRAMFGSDPALGKLAVAVYKRKHANDTTPPEPPHCDQCFEGCALCQH